MNETKFIKDVIAPIKSVTDPIKGAIDPLKNITNHIKAATTPPVALMAAISIETRIKNATSPLVAASFGWNKASESHIQDIINLINDLNKLPNLPDLSFTGMPSQMLTFFEALKNDKLKNTDQILEIFNISKGDLLVGSHDFRDGYVTNRDGYQLNKDGYDRFKNESGLNFTDISSESFRIYEFDNGRSIIIDKPLRLNVSPSGGHRLFDADGVSHYIPKGWIHLKWKAKDGAPHFVK